MDAKEVANRIEALARELLDGAPVGSPALIAAGMLFGGDASVHDGSALELFKLMAPHSRKQLMEGDQRRGIWRN